MSAKMATSGLLQITVFWNKGYEVTNKILSRDSNHIVDVVMWQKFGNSSFSMREVIIILNFNKDLTRKTAFSEGWSWFEFNNLGLALGMNLKFYINVAKGLKLKVRKFYGSVPTFVEVTGEKLVGGILPAPSPYPPPASWIGLRPYGKIMFWSSVFPTKDQS